MLLLYLVLKWFIQQMDVKAASIDEKIDYLL